MYELSTSVDILGLQSVAELAELGHHRHYRRSRRGKNVCLVTGNGSLNGISILNVLNFFG